MAPTSPFNPSPRSELAGFFLVAFGFTWACWISAIFVHTPPTRNHLAQAGQFGPLIAAILMTAFFSGRHGLRRFLASLVRVGFNPLLALLALLLPPVAYYASITLKTWWTGEPAPFHSFRILYDVLINFFLIVLWGGPLGEEPGWRGFALPRLQSVCHPLTATIILGVVWAVWHFPRWWMAGEFPLPIVAMFVLALVGFSVVFTFLYNHARGSVLPCLLLHGSANTFYILVPVEWAWGAWTLVICAIAVLIIAVDPRLGAPGGIALDESPADAPLVPT